MESSSWILGDRMQDDNYKHTVSGKALHLQSRFDNSSGFWRSDPARPLCDLVSFDYSFDATSATETPKRGVINEVLSGFVPWVALNLCCYLLPCQC